MKLKVLGVHATDIRKPIEEAIKKLERLEDHDSFIYRIRLINSMPFHNIRRHTIHNTIALCTFNVIAASYNALIGNLWCLIHFGVFLIVYRFLLKVTRHHKIFIDNLNLLLKTINQHLKDTENGLNEPEMGS